MHAQPINNVGNALGSQAFCGIADIEDLAPNSRGRKCPETAAKGYTESIFAVHWRLDKEEMFSGFSFVKQNLLQLFVQGGDEKRRSLIVDLEAPRFLFSQTNICEASSLRHQSNVQSKQLDIAAMGLNADQGQAIEKVLQAQDYALILGNKSSLLVRLNAFILALCARYARHRQNHDHCSCCEGIGFPWQISASHCLHQHCRCMSAGVSS